MSEVVGTLRTYDAAEREELAQLVAALTDEENVQSLEQLEAIIITRLRNNLEKHSALKRLYRKLLVCDASEVHCPLYKRTVCATIHLPVSNDIHNQ